MDEWFDRDVVTFVIRVSILPKNIGTIKISNMQSEANGFCNLGEILYKNPPQILILFFGVL